MEIFWCLVIVTSPYWFSWLLITFGGGPHYDEKTKREMREYLDDAVDLPDDLKRRLEKIYGI